MRNFKDVYHSAVEELPKYHMDMETVQKALQRRNMKAAARRKRLTSVAVAASVFLVCGITTVTAVNYHQSRIEIRNGGFSIVGGTNAAEEEKVLTAAVEEEDMQPEVSLARANDSVQADQSVTEEGPIEELECSLLQEIEYTSLEEFQAKEDIVIAIPQTDWMGGCIESQRVIYIPDMSCVYITVWSEEGTFCMNQYDSREVEAYASSSVYVGEASNERTFTNRQGFTYQMFDSVENEEIVSTHAAISINGRDLTLDFFGYDESVVEEVLDKLDLSVYFTE